ncbi:hypothetical protein AZA_67943 [Nitrospirillum viridazoti Y2]|nr:hypothetical protein AZA_67943 [Nitrospirillum amazonense Y2]
MRTTGAKAARLPGTSGKPSMRHVAPQPAGGDGHHAGADRHGDGHDAAGGRPALRLRQTVHHLFHQRHQIVGDAHDGQGLHRLLDAHVHAGIAVQRGQQGGALAGQADIHAGAQAGLGAFHAGGQLALKAGGGLHRADAGPQAPLQEQAHALQAGDAILPQFVQPLADDLAIGQAGAEAPAVARHQMAQVDRQVGQAVQDGAVLRRGLAVADAADGILQPAFHVGQDRHGLARLGESQEGGGTVGLDLQNALHQAAQPIVGQAPVLDQGAAVAVAVNMEVQRHPGLTAVDHGAGATAGGEAGGERHGVRLPLRLLDLHVNRRQAPGAQGTEHAVQQGFHRQPGLLTVSAGDGHADAEEFSVVLPLHLGRPAGDGGGDDAIARRLGLWGGQGVQHGQQAAGAGRSLRRGAEVGGLEDLHRRLHRHGHAGVQLLHQHAAQRVIRLYAHDALPLTP